MKSKIKTKFVLVLGLSFVGIAAFAGINRLKTFFEVSAAFEGATGVSSERTEIRTFYQNRSNSLPQKGDLTELNEQSTISTVSLGALYCARMIDKDESNTNLPSRWSHHLVKFDQLPAQGILNQTILSDLIQDYSQLFWQRSLTNGEVNELSTLANDLSNTFPDEAASTKKIALGLCVTFAGSFSSISF